MPGTGLIGQDRLDPAYLAVFEADLDAVRMGGRLGQELSDDAFRERACALVLFQDDMHPHAGLDVFSRDAHDISFFI